MKFARGFDENKVCRIGADLAVGEKTFPAVKEGEANSEKVNSALLSEYDLQLADEMVADEDESDDQTLQWPILPIDDLHLAPTLLSNTNLYIGFDEQSLVPSTLPLPQRPSPSLLPTSLTMTNKS